MVLVDRLNADPLRSGIGILSLQSTRRTCRHNESVRDKGVEMNFEGMF